MAPPCRAPSPAGTPRARSPSPPPAKASPGKGSEPPTPTTASSTGPLAVVGTPNTSGTKVAQLSGPLPTLAHEAAAYLSRNRSLVNADASGEQSDTLLGPGEWPYRQGERPLIKMSPVMASINYNARAEWAEGARCTSSSPSPTARIAHSSPLPKMVAPGPSGPASGRSTPRGGPGRDQAAAALRHAAACSVSPDSQQQGPGSGSKAVATQAGSKDLGAGCDQAGADIGPVLGQHKATKSA